MEHGSLRRLTMAFAAEPAVLPAVAAGLAVLAERGVGYRVAVAAGLVGEPAAVAAVPAAVAAVPAAVAAVAAEPAAVAAVVAVAAALVGNPPSRPPYPPRSSP